MLRPALLIVALLAILDISNLHAVARPNWAPARLQQFQGQALTQSHNRSAQTSTPVRPRREKAAASASAPSLVSSASGRSEAILVAQILLLLTVGRLLGEAMQRMGQPAVMGQLLAGVVLGPSLLGWIWPQAQHFLFPTDPAQKGMIEGISQIGIMLLLLLTGMETDLKLVKKSSFVAGAICLCGITLPFICGFLLGQYLAQSMLSGASGGRLACSLFLGTALSISSIKIVAMVVKQMNFMRRTLGQIIVASAIMEDTVGWVIIAITFGVIGAGGDGRADGVNFLFMGRMVFGVVLFLLFCFTAGRWLVFSVIRWVNDNLRSEFAVVTAILMIMGCFAEVTQLLGVRTVLGAFMAGLLVGQSPILTDHIQQQLRGMITAFFMPVFFGLSGLSADLTILKDPNMALLAAGLVVIASVGKFSGAFLGSVMGRLTWREGVALGCAMNARGSTEVIVASIGLSMGALTHNLYTMIVTMAVVTTMAMPPMLRAALARVPMGVEEQVRIDREAIDRRGFVSRLERLLLAVDTSAVGRMAAWLAGLLAGAQGMPITIVRLELDLRKSSAAQHEPFDAKDARRSGQLARESLVAADDNGSFKRQDRLGQAALAEAATVERTGAVSHKESGAALDADPVAKQVHAGARKSAARVIADSAEPNPQKVHVTARVPVDEPAEVVRDEARKGYDLMFIGLKDSVEEDGGYGIKVKEIAAGFEGPLIVLSHRNEQAFTLTSQSRILVPVNGSAVSRRAAEVAFAIARATGAKVHALFVSQSDSRSRNRIREEGVLKDMIELGERYEVSVTTRLSQRATAGEAILKEEKRNYALIAMGVSARGGEELFFGNTATKILKQWKGPTLMVATS